MRPVEPENPQNNEVWVRYKRVESFFASGPRSRHYTLDYVTGIVSFGDGRRGMVPPEGANNDRRDVSYRIGGGSLGNVNANTLTSLGRALAYIESVTNPLPGDRRRRSRDDRRGEGARAVHDQEPRSRGDDRGLRDAGAARVDAARARASACPIARNRGHVTLALLPKADTRGEELTRRLVPSNEVLRYVKNYLDERKLVGTVLNVVRPRYKDVSLRVVLIRRSVGTSRSPAQGHRGEAAPVPALARRRP